MKCWLRYVEHKEDAPAKEVNVINVKNMDWIHTDPSYADKCSCSRVSRLESAN